MLLDWQVATDYRNENSLLNSLAGAGPGRAGQYSEGGDSGGGRPALRPQLCPAQSSQSGTKQRNAQMSFPRLIDSWGHNLLGCTLTLSTK